jgi:hypothetical protein
MGMIAAAFGYLTPVQGALLQEVIDVAVILKALRALRITLHEATMKTEAVSTGQADIAQGATPRAASRIPKSPLLPKCKQGPLR